MSIQGSINSMIGTVGAAVGGAAPQQHPRSEAALQTAYTERQRMADAYKARRLALDEMKASLQQAALAESIKQRETDEKMQHERVLLERYKIRKGVALTNGQS